MHAAQQQRRALTAHRLSTRAQDAGTKQCYRCLISYHAPHRMLTARFPFLDGATQKDRPHRPQDLHQGVRRCASRRLHSLLSQSSVLVVRIQNDSHSTPTAVPWDVLGLPMSSFLKG